MIDGRNLAAQLRHVNPPEIMGHLPLPTGAGFLNHQQEGDVGMNSTHGNTLLTQKTCNPTYNKHYFVDICYPPEHRYPK